MPSQGLGEGEFDRMLEAIYAVAAQAGDWSDVLRQLAQLLHAPSAALFMHDFHARDLQAGMRVHAVGFDDASLTSYAGHYSRVNVWSANEDRLAAGSVVTSALLYPEVQLPRTEFYADWLRPQGLFHALGGVVARDGVVGAKLSVLRPRSIGEFSSQEATFLQRLYPHLRRTHDLLARAAKTEADAALGRIASRASHLGVFALGEQGEVLHANAIGERWLGEGRVLCVVAGRLHAAVADAAAALRVALKQVAAGGAPVHVSLGDVVNPARWLTVMRMPSSERFALHGSRAALLALVGDTEQRPLASDGQLSDLFGLSPAEARLARAVAQGVNLEAFACERGVSRNTARSQLQSVLSKTGVDSQRALIRLVLAVPAWAG